MALMRTDHDGRLVNPVVRRLTEYAAAAAATTGGAALDLAAFASKLSVKLAILAHGRTLCRLRGINVDEGAGDDR